MPVSISAVARKAVLDQLAAAFNAAHATAATNLGVTPVTINWSAGSKQVFEAFIGPDDLEETSAFDWPAVCLYAARAMNKNRAKYNVFSGEVHVYVDFHLTSRKSSVPVKFEGDMDAIEDALVATFNVPPVWGPNDLAYNGDIEIQRLPVRRASDNWRQTLRARLILELDSN